MAAPENLAPSQNLAPPPTDSNAPPQNLKSNSQSHIFFSPSPPLLAIGGAFYTKLYFFVRLDNTRNLTFFENVNMVKETLKRKLVVSICSFHILQNGNLQNTCKNCFPVAKVIIYIYSFFVIFQIAFRKL